MRIFLLGINCILITSLALLRNARHFPACFRFIVYRDRVARPISGAPATRSCDDTDNYHVAMHSYAVPIGMAFVVRLVPTCLLCMTSCNQFACPWLYESPLRRNYVIAQCDAQWIDRIYISYFIDDSLKLDQVARWWFWWNGIFLRCGI